MIFKEKIGGNKGSYVKLKDVEQNFDGTLFALPYYDNGYWRIRIFGTKTRTRKEIE